MVCENDHKKNNALLEGLLGIKKLYEEKCQLQKKLKKKNCGQVKNRLKLVQSNLKYDNTRLTKYQELKREQRFFASVHEYNNSHPDIKKGCKLPAF